MGESNFYCHMLENHLICIMLKFANAKINIGLQITNKRKDGYHDLETVFYPVKIYDVVEIIPADTLELQIWNSDLAADENNLCLRAFRLLAESYAVDPVKIHLLKHIPMGAGLGGGSSDASATLLLLDDFFNLNLGQERLMELAGQLGADCPFFIANQPMYAEGIGTELSPIDLDLEAYHIIVVKPDVHISTADAYAGVEPKPAANDLREAVKLPIQEWKYGIVNDFELSLFDRYPQLNRLKQKLYETGAIYASMSGSGSAVYGIFEEIPNIKELQEFGTVYLPQHL